MCNINEHDPEIINMWLHGHHKKGYIAISYNPGYDIAPITLNFHEKEFITMDVCNNTKKDIIANKIIITCACLKTSNISVCHYYCIYIDFSTNILIVLDPFGYNKFNRVIIRKIYCVITLWIKSKTGTTLDNLYSDVEYGPLYHYSDCDSGSLCCVIAYHISKKGRPLEMFKLISNLKLFEFRKHLSKILKLSIDSDLSISFPKITGSEADYEYYSEINPNAEDTDTDIYSEANMIAGIKISKNGIGNRYRNINCGIALFGRKKVKVKVRC